MKFKNSVPYEWTGKEHDFQINNWKNLDYSSIKPADMNRHFLITGETGSGKTKSAILPILDSILNYSNIENNNIKPSIFVIDPKMELFNYINNKIKETKNYNLKLFKSDNIEKLWIFEGFKPEEITSELLIEYLRNITDYIIAAENSQQPFFINAALGIIKDLIELDMYLHKNSELPSLNNIEGIFNLLLKEKKDDVVFDSIETILELLEVYEFDNYSYIKLLDEDNYLLKIVLIIRLLSVNEWKKFTIKYRMLIKGDELPNYIELALSNVAKLTNLPLKTYSCVIAGINNLLNEFCASEYVSNISFNPFKSPENMISIKDVMLKKEILVFQPKTFNTKFDDMVGKTFKMILFNLILEKNKTKELQEHPVFYVCDEFQRFITSDDKSGEQSFLDRCRAYRTTCVLATQSLASLDYVLNQYSKNKAKDIVKIILNNTGNKFFFRNTDIDTSSNMTKLIPFPPNEDKKHIIKVRPLSTLNPGECYYLLANGRWGRAQIIKPKNSEISTEENGNITNCEWTEEEDENENYHFKFDNWKNIGLDSLPPSQMNRHFFITGETGSGKTKSGIFPIIKSIMSFAANPGNDLKPSVFAIDPKFEINNYFQKANKDNNTDYKITVYPNGFSEMPKEKQPKIWLFEGFDRNEITGDLILTNLKNIYSVIEKESQSRDKFWYQKTICIFFNLIQLDNYIMKLSNYKYGIERIYNDIIENNSYLEKPKIKTDDENYFLKFTLITTNMFLGKSEEKHASKREIKALNWQVFSERCFELINSDDSVLTDFEKENAKYIMYEFISINKMALETYECVIGHYKNMFTIFCDDYLISQIGLNPYIPPKYFISLKKVISNREIFIYQPKNFSTQYEDIIGKAYKTTLIRIILGKIKFFNSDEKIMKNPIFYICDEFQRFITSDDKSGEQSFLDRCRAFRATCVLATQSIASLEYALKVNGNDNNKSVINIILNNTGNKFFFRNTDTDTSTILSGIIPETPIPYKPHIVTVRPVSTLSPGEIYYLLSNGNWGRAQLQQEVSPGTVLSYFS